MKYIIFLLSLVIFLPEAEAQKYTAYLSTNATWPLSSDKTTYPILWVSKQNTDTKVLVGGFGLGFSYNIDLTPMVEESSIFAFAKTLRCQANIYRSRFYDEVFLQTDYNGAPISAAFGVNTNYNLGLNFLVDIPLFQSKFTLLPGVGMRYLLHNRTFEGIPNRSLKEVVPTAVLGLSYPISQKLLLITKAELDLNHSVFHTDERFLKTYIELGYNF